MNLSCQQRNSDQRNKLVKKKGKAFYSFLSVLVLHFLSFHLMTALMTKLVSEFATVQGVLASQEVDFVGLTLYVYTLRATLGILQKISDSDQCNHTRKQHNSLRSQHIRATSGVVWKSSPPTHRYRKKGFFSNANREYRGKKTNRCEWLGFHYSFLFFFSPV